MKSIKRIISCLFVFVAFLFVFSGFNTKADPIVTDAQIQVTGASVRTTGNAGIRFVGVVGSYDTTNVKAYGIAIAFGEVEVDDITLGATAGGKSVLTATDTALDGEGKFYIVLYGVPEASYVQDVTARAYVVLNDDSVVYATTATTRNLAEVAIQAKNDGFDGGLIDTVVSNIEDNYMVKTITSTSDIVLMSPDTHNYSFADLSDMWAEFIADFNAATGTSLTTSSTMSNLKTAFSNNIANTTRKIPATNNAYKFFKGINMTKWSWLLEYFSSVGGLHLKNQADCLLSLDRVCKDADSYSFIHLAGSIWNFFNMGSADGGWPGTRTYSSESSYSSVPFPTASDTSSFVKIGESITLSVQSAPDYYNNTGFSSNSVDYALNDTFEVTDTNKEFNPVFTPINYTITYYDGLVEQDLAVKNYNVESNILLSTLADSVDYHFEGWCEDSELNDSPVFSISAGTHGNKTYYAKWSFIEPIEYEVSTSDVAILNDKMPDIIVGSTLSGKVTLLAPGGSTLDSGYATKVYNIGNGEVFSSIASALTYIDNYNLQNKKIYVFAGTYNETLSIVENGTYLYGANYGVRGQDSRNNASIITNQVNVDANNITIRGFELTGSANIGLKGNGITIEDIKMYNATHKICYNNNRQGYIVDNTASGVSNVTLKNSYLCSKGTSQSYTNQYMSFTNINGLIMDGNYITNEATTLSDKYAGMYIYTISGTVSIINNEFRYATNGYVFLMGGTANNATLIDIKDNLFTGTAAGNSATISIRNGGSGLTINSIHNDFVNFTTSTYTFNNCSSSTINLLYNYYDSSKNYSVSQLNSNVHLNNDYNYYAGPISASDLSGAASIKHSLTSESEVDNYYNLYLNPTYAEIEYELDGGVNPVGALTEYRVGFDSELLVNPTKDGKSFLGWTYVEDSSDYIYYIPYNKTGDLTLYAQWSDDVVAKIGSTNFPTIQSAINFASSGDTIDVLSGTISESITINKNNITLKGPNYNVDGASNSRVTEAIFNNIITINKNITGFSIIGMKFVDGAKIVNEQIADSSVYVYNNKNFTFNYNIVNKGTDTTGIINITNGDRVYTQNVEISHNYFTGNSLTDSNLIFITNNENMTLNNNVFENINKTCFKIDDTTNGKGESGSFIANNNIFRNIGGSAIWVDWFNPYSADTYSVEVGHNVFDRVDGGACVDFENSQSGVSYLSVSIHHNIYRDVYKCFWGPKFKNSEFTENVIIQDDLSTGPSTGDGYVCKCYQGTNNCQMYNNLFLDKTGTSVVAVQKSWYGTYVNNGSQYATIAAYKTANPGMDLTGYVAN